MGWEVGNQQHARKLLTSGGPGRTWLCLGGLRGTYGWVATGLVELDGSFLKRRQGKLFPPLSLSSGIWSLRNGISLLGSVSGARGTCTHKADLLLPGTSFLMKEREAGKTLTTTLLRAWVTWCKLSTEWISICFLGLHDHCART